MIDALQRTLGSAFCAFVITLVDGSDVEVAWLFTAGMLLGAYILFIMERHR